MSINSAMIAGVSALRANSSALAGISNNIANVNTTAYKREDTSFADIVTEASSPQVYSAGGVRANTAQKVSALGSLQGTTSTLDLGIDGQGFFIGTEKNNPTAVDARVFTRAGSLSKDKDGYLKNAEGFYFQGWPVDNNGLVTTDPSDITKLKPINIANVGGTAEATTKASIVANLNAEQAISTAISGGTYNATSSTAAMSVYHATTGNGRLNIDAGAARAVTKRGSSLLPAGITSVEGSFSAGDPVDLVDDLGVTVARGRVHVDSSELPGLLGRSTKELAKELGPAYEREVVHRDDMVLLE